MLVSCFEKKNICQLNICQLNIYQLKALKTP